MRLLKRKKKKDELAELGIKDDELIDFKEFEEFEEELKKQKETKPEDLAKNFVFELPNGCPICGGDVKGNDYYRYFCDHCNVLFDKKDILEKEFGKSIADASKKPIRKTVLNAEERAELEKKRKDLKDRVYKEFSEEQKQELVEETEEEKEEEPEEEAEPEPEEPEEVEEPEEEEPEPEPEEPEPEEPEDFEEDEPEEEPAPEPEKIEYELEEPDRIIASSQSDKMHAGNCHFVKKINPENRIYLDSIEQGEEQGYEMCVCLRRLKAMQR
jgi:hypothetical protein